jgi:hypothetical protein
MHLYLTLCLISEAVNVLGTQPTAFQLRKIFILLRIL